MNAPDTTPPAGKKTLVTGHVLTGLVALFLIFDATIKVLVLAPAVQGTTELGYPALSLSVAPANAARRLYESEGFRKVGEAGTSWTLLLELRP